MSAAFLATSQRHRGRRAPRAALSLLFDQNLAPALVRFDLQPRNTDAALVKR